MNPRPGRLGVFPLDPDRLGGATAHPVIPSSLSISDFAPVAMWATNTAGACVAMAGAWERFTGRPVDAAAGDGWLAFVHADDRVSLKTKHLAAAARREPFEIEVRFRRADGTYRWIRIHGAPQATDGVFRGFAGCAVDARGLRAERRDAERGLRALEALADLAWDALVVTDGEGRIVRANEAAVELFSARSETVGQLLDTFVPDWPSIRLALGGDAPTLDVRRGDGLTFTTRARAGGLAADDGSGFAVALRRVDPLLPGHERRDGGAGHDLGELVHDLSNVVTALLAGCELARLGLPDDHPVSEELLEISANVQRARELTMKLKPSDRSAPLPASPTQRTPDRAVDPPSVRDQSATAFLGRRPRSRRTPEDPAEVLRSRTVLVVDDEVSIRRSVRAAFEGAGARVHDARHGADALLMWSDLRGRVDLVVTDLRMPEMGGEELAERLRMLRRDLPILFVSGYALDRRVRRRPGDGFLSKPFTADELLEAAGRVVVQPGVGA